MRRLGRSAAPLLLAAALVGPLPAQSGNLNALESAAPTPVIEPLAGAMRAGLAGLWTDPTTAPRSTGAFFSVHQSSYASMRVFQSVVAFRMGPRWSLTLGQSEVPDLFDSSLTNSDPSLSSLHAQAGMAGIDATTRVGSLHASAGLQLFADDNVGDRQSSSVARMHFRFPLTHAVSVGARATRVVGGSIPTEPGRVQLDVTLAHSWHNVEFNVAAAGSQGRLWEFGETGSGIALAWSATVRSVLQLGLGVGRYETTFGNPAYSWYRAGVVSVRAANVRVSASLTGTDLGAGGGYALSIGYEPR